ncbi:MAG TPA: hypothetical protein VFT43_11870, partial [Candidatus Polarisedimenticolia bacterium]|nr:hypothetical protein [Candidatus Polarisedimenticolia bacterium]
MSHSDHPHRHDGEHGVGPGHGAGPEHGAAPEHAASPEHGAASGHGAAPDPRLAALSAGALRALMAAIGQRRMYPPQHPIAARA